MANSLNTDLHNRVVIINRSHLKESLAEKPHLRAVRVLDGFGASSFTNGSAIFVEFLYNGSECRLEGWMVERFATEDEIADAEAVRAGSM